VGDGRGSRSRDSALARSLRAKTRKSVGKRSFGWPARKSGFRQVAPPSDLARAQRPSSMPLLPRSIPLALPLALALFAPSVVQADDAALTSDAYFAVREKLRRDKATDLQARLACEKLVGRAAHLDAWVTEVTKEGAIEADLDDAILSLPELTVRDVDESDAAKLKRRQPIEVVGVVRSCSWIRLTSTLELTVGAAKLVK